jgi:hypothetical protein
MLRVLIPCSRFLKKGKGTNGFLFFAKVNFSRFAIKHGSTASN